MEDLSLLNKKCLANMPMLLDILTTTLEELKIQLSPIYDSIKELVEEDSFSCTDRKKTENLNLFTDNPKHKLVNPLPYMEIMYELNMEKNSKRSLKKFCIQLGYICDDGHVYDESQHVIFFQLIDNSEKSFLEQELLDALKQNIPAQWRIIPFENFDGILMEFDVDDTISADKINRCAEDFKRYILQPVLEELKNRRMCKNNF